MTIKRKLFKRVITLKVDGRTNTAKLLQDVHFEDNVVITIAVAHSHGIPTTQLIAERIQEYADKRDNARNDRTKARFNNLIVEYSMIDEILPDLDIDIEVI